MGLIRCLAVFPIFDRISAFVLLPLTMSVLVGCQTSPPPGLSDRMAAHLANIDPSGLSHGFDLPELNARVAIPRGWQAMTADVTPLYVHQQWRSIAHNTGVGVIYAHLPLPMSAKTLVFLARTQYSQQSPADHQASDHQAANHQAGDHQTDAQTFHQWTDSLSREWFEGENSRYHVKGYVVTSGFEAWAVYSGYRLRNPPDHNELSLAFRSMDSIMPIPLVGR